MTLKIIHWSIRTALATAAALLMLMVPGINAQQTVPTSAYVFTQWIPLLMIAVALGIMIVAVLYMAGYLLDNASLRARAVNQLGQLIGAVIIAVLVVAIMYVYGTAATTSLFVNAIGNSAWKICTNNLPGSSVSILDSSQPTSLTYLPCNSIIYVAVPGANLGVSPSSVSATGQRYLTPYIDFGIGSVFTVIANLTNQAAANLNALYMYEGFIGFLSTLQANTGVCEPGELCAIPIEPRILDIEYSYIAYKGYTMLRYISAPVEEEAALTYYIFLAQLLVVWIVLYLWPYLLAAGIIFEASSYTKRVGGMLIAMVFAALIVYPIIFTMEYVALNGGTADMSPIGAASNSLPTFIINATTIQGHNYKYESNTINFFVLPNMTNIINNNTCLPYEQNLALEELKDSATYLIPFYALVSQAWGAFTTGPPAVLWNCNPNQAINTLFSIADVYGIVGVTAVILPLLNIFITLSALRGISMLLGGDTNLLGLGKLI